MIRSAVLFAMMCTVGEHAASAKSKPAAYPPAIIGKVEAGATQIEAKFSEEGQMYLFADGTEVKIESFAQSPDEIGRFTLTIDRHTKLAAGDRLWVRTGKAGPISKAVLVEAKQAAGAVEAPKPVQGLNAVAKDDQYVSGRTRKAGQTVRIEVFNAKGEATGTSIFAVSNENGDFAAKLAAKLACDAKVRSFSDKDEQLNERPVRCATPEKPEVLLVKEGQSTVSGTAGGADLIDVRIKVGEQTVAHKTGAVDPKSGEFTVTLPDKLGAGEQVELIGFSGDRPGQTLTANVASVEYNWGRVRAYFTGGVILSANNRSFSNQDPFLGFNIDKSWMQLRRNSVWDKVRINTFFDTRLASIAVAAATDSTAPAASKTVRSATAAAPDNLQTFQDSQKVGVMQTGLYIPISLTNWKFGKEHNSLFLGPLAKAGFATGVESSTNASAPRFYPFHGMGFRLGHFKEYKEITEDGDLVASKSIAPELISYMDVVFGPYRNFIATAQNPSLSQQLRRASFEGILKIPYTPFIVGFNANLGVQHRKGFTPAGDDLRFLFGTRFDVGRLFAKLLSF